MRLFNLFILMLLSCIATFSWAGNNAAYISQSVPHAMAAGRDVPVSVTMKNTGTTTWAGPNYRLASQNPAGNWNWNIPRVLLNANESVPPGGVKTFTFMVKPEAITSFAPVYRNFQWQMIQEGTEFFGAVTENIVVELIYTPDISTSQPPIKTPATVQANDFIFNNFFGANILQGGPPRSDGVTTWIPTTSQMQVIAKKASDMNLTTFRLLVPIPPDNNPAAVAPLINAIKQTLDIAYANGMKTIVTLSGYTKYSFGKHCAWEVAFQEVQTNSASIVRSLYNHPGLLAWDLNNEPLTKAQQGCMSNVGDVKEVVDAVYAMYNLVRTNDPSNKPTTVGEGNVPYTRYWNAVSSFASPHLYIWLNKDAVSLAPIPMIVNGSINYLRAEVGARPVVIGEWGFMYPDAAPTRQIQADASAKFFEAINASNLNVGNMIWQLSTAADQQSFSIMNTDGTLHPVGNIVATQKPFAPNAQFVSQVVPTTMLKGQSYNASVTFKNTGNTIWSREEYAIGANNPENNWNFGLPRKYLNSSPLEIVLPGQSKTFIFTVTAPPTAGNYNFQWRMLKEQRGWFGAASQNVVITVK